MTSRAKAGKKENPAHGEEFEVLDVRDLGKEADSLIRSLQKYLKEKSNSKQLAVGGVSGWYFKNGFKTLQKFTYRRFTGSRDMLP